MSSQRTSLAISLAICALLARGAEGAGPLAPRGPVAMRAPQVYRLPALQPSPSRSAGATLAPRPVSPTEALRNNQAPPLPARMQPAVQSGPARNAASYGYSQQYLLTLPQAFELALTQNPLVVAQRAAEGVGVAAVGVARRYPFNPFFQFQATPIQKAPASATAIEPNAATKIYQYYLVMVNFELAHQRRYRERSASATLNGVRWTIQQTELQSLATTEQLYFMALYRRGLRDVARANAELNASLLSILERQLDAGQASAADVAMVRLDARSTVQVQRLAETNYQTALLDLGRQLNLPPSAPLQLAGELHDWRWMPATGDHLSRVVGLRSVISNTADVETIAAELAAGRPDVMAAQANIAAGQANISLARADRLPTLQFGPYYQSDDFGIKYYGFRGQVQQGALNGGKPLVRQRQAETRQQRINYEQLRARAKLEALTAIDRYERARRLVEETGAEAQFDVPIELKKLEEQFLAGEVDALRIFNARSSLVRLQQAYLDTLNEAAQAAALVTLATGLPPDALVQGVVRETLPPLPPVQQPRLGAPR